MKIYKLFLVAAASLAALGSCGDDEKVPGNPVLEPLTTFTSAYFADSLAFSARVSDASVPLSTLKAELYFGDEMVSQTVVRTKTNGEYSDKIYIPYYAGIPDGEATLKLVLQNIHFTIAEQSFPLAVSRPDFPSLKLVTEDGAELTMARTAKYNYAVVGDFPAKVKAYIVAPAYGQNGNDVTFGMTSGAITQGSTSYISFSEASAGTYSITFNTLTYAAAPFVVVTINGKELSIVDDNNSAVVLNLAKGAEMVFDGISNIEDWWMDPSFFELDGSVYKFRAIDGYYKMTANFALEYFRVEATDSAGKALTLQSDGTGAVWIIGDNIGHPNLDNWTGWTTEKAVCMAQIEPKVYQVRLVATENESDGQLTYDSVNFKFFHQANWGGEFSGTQLSCESDLVFVGDGSDATATKPKRDSGNLGLYIGETFEIGAMYQFTLTLASSTSGVLTVEKL